MRLFRRIVPSFALVLLLLGVTDPANAKPLVLYDADGTQVNDYDAKVENAGPGDVLDMGDGNKFRILRRIDHGNLSMIFETVEKTALRIPLHKGFAEIVKRNYIDALSEWYYTGSKLAETEIPVPHIFAGKSDPNRYVSEELVDMRFNLKDFVQKTPKELGLSDEEYRKAMAGLISFAKKTWQLRWISDFHVKQMIWNGRKWILLDFGAKAVRAGNNFKNTVFDFPSLSKFIPPDLLNTLKAAAIESRRKRRGAFSCVSNRLQLSLSK